MIINIICETVFRGRLGWRRQLNIERKNCQTRRFCPLWPLSDCSVSSQFKERTSDHISKGNRIRTQTCKQHTRWHAYIWTNTPHLPRDPFGHGLSTVSPFKVGGHWTPRATRPSHPPTWPGPPGAKGTRKGGRGVRGIMAVIGRWSKGPLLMTPIGWEADGRTGVKATVAV